MHIESRGHLIEIHDPDPETKAYLDSIRVKRSRIGGEWAKKLGGGRWQLSNVAARKLRAASA